MRRRAVVVARVVGAEVGSAVAADLVAVEDLAEASEVVEALAVVAPEEAGRTDIPVCRPFIAASGPNRSGDATETDRNVCPALSASGRSLVVFRHTKRDG